MAKIFLVVFLFLFGLLFFLYHVMVYTVSFSVIPYNHTSANSKLSYSKKNLFAGNKVFGEFRAKTNYLGAVALGIHNYNPGNKINGNLIPEDKILFRIREVGASKWYYQHVYSGGQFHELMVFPFGFPIINNSEGKMYQYELSSLSGNNDNYLTLSDKPVIISEYQYPREKLIHNWRYLLSFIMKKMLFISYTLDAYFAAFVCFSPFILYLIFISPLRNKIMHPIINSARKFKLYHGILNKKLSEHIEQLTIIQVVTCTLIIIHSVLITDYDTFLMFIILGMWILDLKLQMRTPKASLLGGLFFIFLAISLSIFNLTTISEKLEIWGYYFFIIGIFQQMWIFTTTSKEYELKHV